MIRVLFVCMGNICRSPAAESVFRHYVQQAGLESEITCESAGTLGSHAGEKSDPRMIRWAGVRGFVLNGRARKVITDDFGRFDHIIVMDNENFETVKALACNDVECSKVTPMGTYHPDPDVTEIPDPYYGGMGGFNHVLDLLEVACRHLLDEIIEKHQLKRR